MMLASIKLQILNKCLYVVSNVTRNVLKSDFISYLLYQEWIYDYTLSS